MAKGYFALMSHVIDRSCLGRGSPIEFGTAVTWLGEVRVVWSESGLLSVQFAPSEPLAFYSKMPRASLRPSPQKAREWAEKIFCSHRSLFMDRNRSLRLETVPTVPIPIVLEGTPFQIRVWQTLMQIPPGEVVSYSEVARRLGKPLASRAVGSAIGANRLAYLVPCHRVVSKSGDGSHYRWGSEIKKRLLETEGLSLES